MRTNRLVCPLRWTSFHKSGDPWAPAGAAPTSGRLRGRTASGRGLGAAGSGGRSFRQARATPQVPMANCSEKWMSRLMPIRTAAGTGAGAGAAGRRRRCRPPPRVNLTYCAAPVSSSYTPWESARATRTPKGQVTTGRAMATNDQAYDRNGALRRVGAPTAQAAHDPGHGPDFGQHDQGPRPTNSGSTPPHTWVTARTGHPTRTRPNTAAAAATACRARSPAAAGRWPGGIRRVRRIGLLDDRPGHEERGEHAGDGRLDEQQGQGELLTEFGRAGPGGGSGRSGAGRGPGGRRPGR